MFSHFAAHFNVIGLVPCQSTLYSHTEFSEQLLALLIEKYSQQLQVQNIIPSEGFFFHI